MFMISDGYISKLLSYFAEEVMRGMKIRKTSVCWIE